MWDSVPIGSQMTSVSFVDHFMFVVTQYEYIKWGLHYSGEKASFIGETAVVQ